MRILTELTSQDWMYRYKRRIIFGIIAVLTVSISTAMIFIAVTLRNSLIADSKQKTHELGDAIQLSLGYLMLARDPGKIQSTLETIVKNESSVIKAFILDKNGRVAFSSRKNEAGFLINRFSDASCRGCHKGPVAVPSDTTMIITVKGEEILRNVNIILNEKACHGCHSPSDMINGKLIIDRSIKTTYDLINTIELMIVISGILCIVFLVPFLCRVLSKGVNKYIQEIMQKSTELALLYRIVERLSKTIEMEELKQIVVDIIRDALDADEIDIILPREGREFTAIEWKRGEGTARKKVGADDPLYKVIQEWIVGEITSEMLSGDGREIYMPIIKSGNRLALIAVRKKDPAFDAVRFNLLKAMGSHIAVAFENAVLYHIAITDELTGLYSARHFRSSIEKKFMLFEQYGEKLSLLMLDIDDFKRINDTYGHPAGDGILKNLGQHILASTRDGDTAFRYGGEEFSVILPATDSSGARYVAERIRKKIEGAVFDISNVKLKITVSVGAASCPGNAQTIKDLIVEADKALYQAKRAGKNRVVVSRAK